MFQTKNLTRIKRPCIPLPALLGLDKLPPGPKQSNKFFYKSPLIAQRLSLLNHTVNSHSLVIVIIGERGSGKTTLMNQFIADARNQWQECRIRLKPKQKMPAGVLRNLHNRMVFLSKKGSLPTVIIDDAHQLSRVELKLLLQLTCEKTKRRKFQSIIFFAEPEMRGRFAEIVRRLPPKTTFDKIFMSPLTEHQTAQYLAHRFKTAGILKKAPFTTSQIRSIYKDSGGLPGWINGQAFLLLKKMYRGKNQFKKPLVKWWFETIDWRSLFRTKSLRFSN